MYKRQVIFNPVSAAPTAPSLPSTKPLEVLLFCLICVPTTMLGVFKSEDRPTVTFLSNTSIGLEGRRFLSLKVCNSGCTS